MEDRPVAAGSWAAFASRASPIFLTAMLVATIPAIFDAPSFTWRVVLGITALPLVVVTLACTLPLREPLTWAPLALVALAVIATATSPFGPSESVLGPYGEGGGLLLVALAAGAYCLPFALPTDARLAPSWARALSIAFAAHVVTAIWQAVGKDPYEAYLHTDFDRVRGLAGNPVFLGSLMAGACAFSARRVWRDRAGTLLFVGSAVALALSGSRAGLAAAVLGSLVAAWEPPGAVHDDVPRADPDVGGVRRGHRLLRVALVEVTLVAAVLMASWANSSRGDTSVAQRLAEETSIEGGSIRARVENWRAAADAITDRPLFGAGPGSFRLATMPHRSLELARAEGPDQYFGDAHSLPVEWAVTVGVPGGLLAVVWLLTSLWVARRPGDGLFGAALALTIAQLVQPLRLGVTIPLFLLLGLAASRRRGPPARDRGPMLALAAVPAIAFAPTGMRATAADALLRPALRSADLAAAQQAIDAAPFFLQTYVAAIKVELGRARVPEVEPRPAEAIARAFLLAGIAQERFPEEPVSFVAEALVAQQAGDLPRALGAWQEVLDLDRVSVRARVSRARILIDLGRLDEARRALDEAEAIAATPLLRRARAELAQAARSHRG